jgi:hypothetical protein
MYIVKSDTNGKLSIYTQVFALLLQYLGVECELNCQLILCQHSVGEDCLQMNCCQNRPPPPHPTTIPDLAQL